MFVNVKKLIADSCEGGSQLVEIIGSSQAEVKTVPNPPGESECSKILDDSNYSFLPLFCSFKPT